MKRLGATIGGLGCLFCLPYSPDVNVWPKVLNRKFFQPNDKRITLPLGPSTTLPEKTRDMRMSVIVPLHNEGKEALARTLSNLNQNARRSVQVVLVDAGCTDDTLEGLNDYGKLDIVVLASESGRGMALRKGAAAATGGILLFLHCDCQLPVDFDKSVRCALKDPSVAMTAFRFKIAGETKLSYKMVENSTNFRSSYLWLPYGDQCYGFTRDMYLKLDGFRDLKMMEDFDLVYRTRNMALIEGYRIEILPGQIPCSARRWEKNGVLANTFYNWLFVALFRFGLASPNEIYGYYYGK